MVVDHLVKDFSLDLKLVILVFKGSIFVVLNLVICKWATIEALIIILVLCLLVIMSWLSIYRAAEIAGLILNISAIVIVIIKRILRFLFVVGVWYPAFILVLLPALVPHIIASAWTHVSLLLAPVRWVLSSNSMHSYLLTMILDIFVHMFIYELSINLVMLGFPKEVVISILESVFVFKLLAWLCILLLLPN